MSRCVRTDDPGEQGSATLVLVMLLSLTLTLAAAVAALGQVVRARGFASAAADMAALAAAKQRDCRSAELVARLNTANLVDCRADGDDMTVVVEVPVRVIGRELLVSAASRAGPP